MPEKIIVAGAGHGGLCAAIHLAKAGYDVTVYEKNDRENMGYDWRDFVDVSTFSSAGLDEPDCNVEYFYDTAFFGPGKDIKLVHNFAPDSPCVSIERKDVLNHLLSAAEKSGVKLVFGVNVLRAVIEDNKVAGLEIAYPDISEIVYGDLVIDSAGADSPVRKSLPESSGIQREFQDSEIFTAYRAIFKRKSGYFTSPKYSIFFYHCGRKGMDWLITENDCVDVLVGNFGKLTQKDIDEALSDFKKDFDCLSDNLLRGGKICRIPVRKALGKFVCSGYAAVGDSAAMVEPLSGSGMTISMRAGKILAETVINIGDGDFSEESLKKYENEYFKKIGNSRKKSDAEKNFLLNAGAELFDKMLHRGILTQKDFGGGEYTFKETLRRVFGFIRTPSVIPKAVRLLTNYRKAKK